MDILEISNSLEKLEFVVPLKHDTKKTPFCMFYNRFFPEYGIQYNHWVGNSLMKPVDSVSFHKMKALRGGNNFKNYNFEMDNLD